MSRKIKKLTICAEKSGYCGWQPNEIEKQYVTIKSNGQVWWNATRTLTMKEKRKGFSNNGVKVSEYKNIGREKAEEILARAENFFKDRIEMKFQSLICDASLDTVHIIYENNEVIFGQLNEFTYQSDEIEKFYDYLSEELLIESLLWFDD